MSWPRVDLLGVRVDDLSLEELLDSFDRVIQSGSKAVFANVNIHAFNLAYRLEWFRSFINRCRLVYCDGEGVRLGAWLAGSRLRYRHTPADWLPDLCGRAETAGHSMYLLGSRAGVAEQAAERLLAAYPQLRIVGTHHGYFDRARGSRDNAEILAQISQVSPDILFVAMGMPLQEAWIEDHLEQLEARVIVPVGALLDYTSGQLTRPPRVLRENGFEWLGRLLIEPGRLWKRYLLGNPLFIARVLRHRLRGG